MAKATEAGEREKEKRRRIEKKRKRSRRSGRKDAAAAVKFVLSTLLSCYWYSGILGFW